MYKKNFVPFIISSVFVVLSFAGCSQPGPAPIRFDVSDFKFDYVSGCLSIKSNAPKGASVSLGVNNVLLTADAEEEIVQFPAEGKFIDSSKDGGKSFALNFKAAVYENSIQKKFSYLPEIQIKNFESYFQVLSNVTDFEKDPVFPEVVTNYDSSTIKSTWEYYYTDSSDISDIEYTGTKFAGGLDEVKTFVKNASNEGKTIVGKCMVVSKENENIKCDRLCTWKVVKVDVADSLKIKTDDNITFIAIVKKGSEDIDTDGIIKWYADGIECAAGKAYKLREEDLDKTLSCTLEQKFTGAQKLTETYSKKLFAPIVHANVSYMSDFILEGSCPIADSISARSVLTYFGKELNPRNVTVLPSVMVEKGTKIVDGVEVPDYEYKPGKYEDWQSKTYNSSEIDSVYLEVPGYDELYQTIVEIPVMYNLTESKMPSLSKDINQISSGNVKFENIQMPMSYKIGENGEWCSINESEFACEKDDVIFVKINKLGVPGSALYIAESEAKQIVVTQNNIGVKVTHSDSDVEIEKNQISITIVESNSRNVKAFKVSIPDSMKDMISSFGTDVTYTWSVDNVKPEIESCYSYSSDKKTFYVNVTDWMPENYIVRLYVMKKYDVVGMAQLTFSLR